MNLLAHLPRPILIRLLLALSLATVLLSFGLSFMLLRQLLQPKPHSHCLLFDKPPRTGSSTISAALNSCLQSRKFTVPRIPGAVSSERVLQHVLEQRSTRIAVVSVHLTIYPPDLLRLRSQCSNVLYVTATRPMRERLLSKAKYDVTTGHQSAVLDAPAYRRALAALRSDVLTEPRLERYPFRNCSLEPHYVVRADNFRDDLSHLLRAFKCDANFKDQNVHTLANNASAVQDESAVINSISLRSDDRRHLRMSQLALWSNPRGLRLASSFVNSM